MSTAKKTPSRSFAQTSMRLTEAATQLSAAAKALSSAAAALKASASNHQNSLVIAGYLGPAQKQITSAVNGRTSETCLTDEECTNPEDSDYYFSDAPNYDEHSARQEERLKKPLLAGIVRSGARTRNMTPESQMRFPSDNPSENRSVELFRVTTDSEGEVLPMACAAILHHKKVICYMGCEPGDIGVYKSVIENVTKFVVHGITSVSDEHVNSIGSNLSENAKVVLLLPDTICLDNGFLNPPNDCVIHIGWPSDKDRYKRQINLHRAPTNIVITFREDADIYSSGLTIIEEATPWPGPANITDSLTAAFNQALSEVSDRNKERIYLNWITSHSQGGARRVEMWDAVTIVHRANLYLLDVLQYNGGISADPTGGFQVSLPRVSREFVTENNLEAAVEEEVLHVVGDYNTQVNGDDKLVPRGAIQLNETDQSHNSGPVEFSDCVKDDSSVSHVVEEVAQPSSCIPEPRSPTPIFDLRPGNAYIPIEEEFDAIPLICFLANIHRTLICFLDDESALTHYGTLMSDILNHKIHYPRIAKDATALDSAVRAFISESSPALLLLSITTKALPAILKSSSIGGVVHWGFQSPLSHAIKHYQQVSYESSYIVKTPGQQARQRGGRGANITRHTCSELVTSQQEHSLLADMRSKTRSVLASNRGLVQKMYTARAFWLARIPRQTMSAEEVAQNTNKYSARILLYGKEEDGNRTFKPVGERPSLPQSMIEKYSLQPAVELGLFSVRQ